jgi:RNA polymerase sigma-70 factor, ECF subfamily
MPTDERVLRRAVLAGDDAAWRALYDESFERLRVFVLWRSGGLHELADDVIQDTWLIAVRRIRRFDPNQGSFLGWLRGIAINVLRNQLRARRKRRTAPLRDEFAVAAPPTADRDRAERLADALLDLSERYESVLRAKYLEGQSVADIAATWKETPKAIESLLTRARNALREAYKRRESSDE